MEDSDENTVQLQEKTELDLQEEGTLTDASADKGSEYIVAHRTDPNSLNYFRGFMLLTKMALGTGVLATPEAFSRSGLSGRFILSWFITVIGLYTNWSTAHTH